MKNKLLFFSSLALFSLMMAFSSCKKDPCETTNCKNGGECVEGTCECPTGFEGIDCGTDMRDKFYGKYLWVDEYGWEYNLIIAKNNAPATVYFKINEPNYILDFLEAKINSSGKLELQPNNWGFAGTGVMVSPTKLDMTITKTTFGEDETTVRHYEKVD